MRVRAAWLIEGVRMDGPARMAPLSLSPVSLDRGYVGREARDIFNAELADAGFVTAVERPIWGAQTGPYRRLVRAISDELDIEGVSEVIALESVAARSADVLAVIWGGAPEVIAGATEVWEDRKGEWRTMSVSVGGGAWQSSIVRKLLPDGAVLEDDDPGYWPPPPLPTRSETRRAGVADAFAVAARGDGLERGWLRYADASCAAVEVVLRSALNGQLIGE